MRREKTAGAAKRRMAFQYAAGEMCIRDRIPSDYTRVEEETIFINEAKGCGMMMDYLWNIDGPIYSLADVESQREAIAANLMQNLFEVSDYQILAAGPDQVGLSLIHI